MAPKEALKAILLFSFISVALLLLVAGCIQEAPGPSPGSGPGEAGSLTGNETLEVFVLNTDSSPLANIEVDLWRKETQGGPPDVGFALSDAQGKAIFKVPAGEYRIGFNQENFPQNLQYPDAYFVTVGEGATNSKTITLGVKEELLERNLVALGDSFTKANNPSSDMVGDFEDYSFSTGDKINSVFVYLRGRGENIVPRNLAESGATSGDVLATQAKNVEGYDPRYITILVGGADILAGVSEQAFKSNLRGIVERVKGDGRTIMVATLPNTPGMRIAAFKACGEDVLQLNVENLTEEKIQAFNQAISEVASEQGLLLVDLFDALGPEHVSDYDCLHPNVAGQEKAAGEFIKALEK